MSGSYIINENFDRFKVLGRCSAAEGGGINCDHVGSGIAFHARVDGRISLKIRLKFGWVEGDPMLEQYFALFVDGERQQRLMLKGEKDRETVHSLTICDNRYGEHTFEVIRSNEAMQCQMVFESLELEGELLEKPADRKLFIEFLGDSITAGYGNLSPCIDCEYPNAGRTSDGTQTYAFLTAEALGADFASVCASGMAFSYGLGDHPVSWFYSNTGCFRSNKDKYDFSRPADLVVVNLGTNDWDNCPHRGYETEDLREYVKPVIRLIRRHRPDVRIVWAYGMMNTGYADAISEGLNDLGGEENGLYFCRLPYDDFPRGGCWHPSVAGQQAAAKALTEYLKKIV